MSDLDLARRAVACPGWRWMAGMRLTNGYRIAQDDIDSEPEFWPPRMLPDLDDPCTLGVLLALVRERWGDGAHVTPDRSVTPNGEWWVWADVDGRWTVVGIGTSKAAALVAALEATP